MMKLTVSFTFLLLCGVNLSGILTADDRPPNVLLLIADDLNSWLLGDADRYSGKVVAPNLRRLAASGVNFTRAYTASPVCSPSRTAFFQE